MPKEVKDWWEATAQYFQEEIDLDVGLNWMGFESGALNLLEDVAGADILELGCGGGQCTVALAQRGGNMTGLDFSEEQLAHARSLANDHDVDVAFVQGDVTDLGMFADESYDITFNTWVFQWVDDLSACFTEIHRILRSEGRFVFSIPHPIYGVVDSESHAVTESYFDTGRYEISHEEMDIVQVMFRHTVSDIFNALVRAGFTVERIHEPGTSDPTDYDPGPWGEFTPDLMSKLPAVLAFEAGKQCPYGEVRKH